MDPRAPFLSPDEEAEILGGVRAGGAARREAFDRLYRSLRAPIHAACLHLTGGREDADEAVVQAFAAVRRALPGFSGACRITTWVYRIALRAAFRARVRRGASAAPRLPAAQGAVLALFAVEGLPPHEIADILGVPEENAGQRLAEARGMPPGQALTEGDP